MNEYYVLISHFFNNGKFSYSVEKREGEMSSKGVFINYSQEDYYEDYYKTRAEVSRAIKELKQA